MSSKVSLALIFFGREGVPLTAWPRYNYDVGGRVNELLSECSSWCVDDCEFVIKK